MRIKGTETQGRIEAFKDGRGGDILQIDHIGCFCHEGNPCDVFGIKLVSDVKLELIERPKKKVTKTVERWVNFYDNNLEFFFKDEDEANSFVYSQINRLNASPIKLTGSYEVEE